MIYRSVIKVHLTDKEKFRWKRFLTVKRLMAKGLSQVDIAKELGVSRSRIGQLLKEIEFSFRADMYVLNTDFKKLWICLEAGNLVIPEEDVYGTAKETE